MGISEYSTRELTDEITRRKISKIPDQRTENEVLRNLFDARKFLDNNFHTIASDGTIDWDFTRKAVRHLVSIIYGPDGLQWFSQYVE